MACVRRRMMRYRPAPQGARGSGVAARASRARPTPGGRRVPAARRCAPFRALRRARPALSTHRRGVATRAVPPLRFAAPHFLAKRSGFLYLCAIAARRRLRSPRRQDSLLHRGAQGWIALTASSSAELGKQDPIFLPSAQFPAQKVDRCVIFVAKLLGRSPCWDILVPSMAWPHPGAIACPLGSR